MVCLSIIGYSYESSAQINEFDIRQNILDTLRYYTTVVVESPKQSNSHWAITRFNKNAKRTKHEPYCSSFLLYGYNKNNVFPPKVNAVAYSWRQGKRLIFYPAMLKDPERAKRALQLMDVVVMTWSHVEGFTDIDLKRREITTIAGNTKGGRNVEGCYYPIRRNLRYVMGIYNHITPFVKAHEDELIQKITF